MLPIITLALLSFAGAGFASGRGLNQIVNTADDVLVEDANLWMPDASKDNDDSNLRLLITFQTSPEDKTGEVDPMTISALAEISSLANVKNVKKISPRAGIHLVIISNAREAKQTMRELKKNEHVKSVEQDHLVYASDINPDEHRYLITNRAQNNSLYSLYEHRYLDGTRLFLHSTRTNLRGVNRLYLVRKKRMRSRTGTIKAHNLR